MQLESGPCRQGDSDKGAPLLAPEEGAAFTSGPNPCSVAQGKVSWWYWRRGRSQGATKTCEVNAPPHVSHSVPPAVGDGETRGGAEPHALCCFYESVGAGAAAHPGSSSGALGTAGTSPCPNLVRLAGAIRRASAGQLSSSAAPDTPSFAMVLALAPEELPLFPSVGSPNHGPATEVAALGLAMEGGGALTVAMPVCALQPSEPRLPPSGQADGEKPTNLELAHAARRTLDPEIGMLGAYLGFLDAVSNAPRRAAAASSERPRSVSVGGGVGGWC